MPLSAVLVTYCSALTIIECLSSVAGELASDDEIVVVDNASTDDTIQSVESFAGADERVRVLRQAENRGYSKACNFGVHATSHGIVILLNPDTMVSPGAIQAIVQALGVPNCGASGPLGDNVPGDQFVLKHYPDLDLATVSGVPRSDETVETKLLSGFCMAFRRETLGKVGLLDEDLFLGADDLEMSWRLRTMGY